MPALAVRIVRWPRHLVVALIRVYQVLASPFPSPCRFTPSCSTYAVAAVRRYGVMTGAWLGVWRILRCHPLYPGGDDPVP